MSQTFGKRPDLPKKARSLGLELSFLLSQIAAIERGYEYQGEKWSVYFQGDWVQIWRPSRTGVCCYSLRLKKVDDQRIGVVESWVASEVIDSFSPDLEQHRKIVIFVLESVAGDSYEKLKDLGTKFEYQSVSGRRRPRSVSFSGEVTNLGDVDEIAERLRDEVAQMLKDSL